jgi:predicted transcriptional regulator
MGNDRSPLDQVAFLARSESRVRVLERLLTSGSTTRREFREALGASRSTVTRSLSQLEARNWIQGSDDAYELTPAGRLVAQQFLGLVESVETTEALSPFLDWFPYAEYPIDLDDLVGADIISSTGADPYAPGRRQTSFIDHHEEVWLVLPSIELESVRAAHEQVLTETLCLSVVVSDAVAERIVTDEFATLFREQIDTGRMDVYAVDGDLPFYLGFGGDATVQLGVEDDDGFPRALLEVESEPLHSWAEEVYDDHRHRAERMSRAAFAEP